jgi:hypothetical protein
MKERFEVQVTVLFMLECEPEDDGMPSRSQIDEAIADEFPGRDTETIDWRSTEEII